MVDHIEPLPECGPGATVGAVARLVAPLDVQTSAAKKAKMFANPSMMA